MPEPRKWSFITGAQFTTYLEQAQTVIAFARSQEIPIFAAALAGVAFIRAALTSMGGDASWWAELITSSDPDPFGDLRSGKGPPGKQ